MGRLQHNYLRPDIKFNNWRSLFAILLIALVVSGVFCNMKRWRQPMSVIQWDIKNYYAYLPAVFIFGDHSLEFIKQDPDFFSDKFWPIPTPSGGLVIITTMGLAFLYLPFFLLGHLTAFISGADMNGFSPPYAMWLVFSSLFYVIAGLLALRKALLHFFSDAMVAITILVVIFATNLFYYTSHEGPMSHAYSFALFSFFLLLTIRWHQKPDLKKSLLLGLISGLIVLIRPTNIVILFFFVFYNVKSFNGLKQKAGLFAANYGYIFIMALAALLVWLPQMFYWKSVSGQWFFYSYKQGEGFFFDSPQIINGLFSYRKGWLVYTPVMIIALAGIALLWKNRREFFWPVLLFVVVNIYVVLSWWAWWYGGGLGQRAFIESYALLSVPLASLLETVALWNKTAKRLVVAVSFLFMAHGIFQTAQYHYGAIHWDSMSKTTYWASFGRIRPLAGFYQALEPPDYQLAAIGIQAVVKPPTPDPGILQSIVFDMETIDPTSHVVGSTQKGHTISAGRSLCTRKAYNGRHSLRLGRKTEQHIDLFIQTMPGEKWLVSVKRKSAWFNGALVLTGNQGAHFYKEIRVGVPSAIPGWDSLALDVQIPEGQLSNLQVILRNTGWVNSWFDDLIINKVE